MKEQIRRLCQRETGYLAVVGENGTGKSVMVAKVLQSKDDFISKQCPSIESVVWLNLTKISSDPDISVFYFTLANLIGIKIRKPETQTQKPLDEQIREALISKRFKPASILLVLDDVFSECILPLIAPFQYKIRCVAISRFNTTLAMQEFSPTGVVNVHPMKANELAKIIMEMMPPNLLTEQQVMKLVDVASGLPIIIRLICGHFHGIETTEAANAKYDQIMAALTESNSKSGTKRKVQNTILQLLKIHFEKDTEGFKSFCGFLLFEEETPVDATDLSMIWNCEIDDVTDYCSNHFCKQGVLQSIYFDDSRRKSEAQIFFDPDETFDVFSMEVDECPIILKKHYYSVNTLIFQATAEFLRKYTPKGVHINDIVRNAGRTHPLASKGENILHLTSRYQRTGLIKNIIERTDTDTLVELCNEKSAVGQTPIDYLCSLSMKTFIVDEPPPMISKALLPLLERLTPTGMTGKILEETIIPKKVPVDKLLLLSCDMGYSFLAAKLICLAKANVDARKERWPNYSCLMLASKNGREHVVKTLLENGANVNAKDGQGRGSVMLAVEMGREDIVKVLLSYGGDVDTEEGVWPSFMLALARRYESIAKLLLMKSDSSISEEYSGEALLNAAKTCRDPIVVGYLLEKGGDPNFRDVLGRTPLIYAVTHGLEGNVRLLLDNGATADMRDKNKDSALLIASLQGLETIVKLLLENKAKPDLKDRLDRAPITLATLNNHEGIVKLLIESGADVNTVDSQRRTPLWIAADQGNESLVDLLLSSNAKTEITDLVFHATPLMKAVGNGNHKIVMNLIENKCDVNTEDDFHRRTALMVAAEKGHADIVESLLKNGAKVDQGNYMGITPLMLAVLNQQTECVELLVKNGAEKNTKNSQGKSAVDLASSQNIARLLQ